MKFVKSRFKKAFNVQSEQFRPLWIRIAIVAVCFGWALFELKYAPWSNWAIVYGAVGGFLFYQFFIVFDPKPDEESDGEDAEAEKEEEEEEDK